MRMRPQNRLKFVALLILSVLLLSCEAVSYYTQAARGQLSILIGRTDINRLLADPGLSIELREKLERVLAIRDFAESELLLPVNDNYSTFVDVQREHVIWNVFAAPEFSTDAVNWCYPIAGCVSYRGYFSEQAANRFADKLADRNFDVYTGGVDAYSTLGWFDDSLLSTVINRTDYQLAGLIFHELAHQLVYVQGDTTFNESFATALEREAVRRWLSANQQAELIEAAEDSMQRQAEFVALVSDWRTRFTQLYQQDLPDQRMREQKTGLQRQLRAAYESRKREWGDYDGYDSWFARSLNNAQLSTVASYNDLVPAFDALLAMHEGSLQDFYLAVQELAAMTEEQRNSALTALNP